MLVVAQESTTDRLNDLLDEADHVIAIIATLLLAALLSRLVRALIIRLLDWVATRRRRGVENFWIVRRPRLLDESTEVAERRRTQRVRASALMLSRLASVVIWLVAFVVVLAILDVDVVWAVSSAGFLGAAIAIGGQHSVHDYLNGVHILLEDRFGEGDLIEVTHPSGVVRRGTVQRIGAFGTDLRSEEGTWHMANRMLAEVVNLSQAPQRPASPPDDTSA